MEDLSLAELVGQMMIVSLTRTKIDPEAHTLLRNIRPGGIILFRENYENYNQFKQWCAALHEVPQSWPKKIPLFISVDQEGGRVMRLPAPFTQIPPARIIGTRGARYAYQAASTIARELREVGVNMNHAPVLDVDTNSENPVIGDRSFGDNPRKVAHIAERFFRGLQDNKIISTGKHFPGHGDSKTDSHLALPRIDHDKSRIEEIELYPFKRAIEQGIDTIMTAHVLYPSLDTMYPATLSERIVEGILRERLGFRGVIISDDLSMNAISLNYDLGDACYKAICAGITMLLISHQPYNVYESIHRTLLDRLRKDTDRLSFIRQEVARILELKKRYLDYE
ncbi:MAG: beta-N-acetylhexosaminidase [bacterium]